jgi:phosphomannomutase
MAAHELSLSALVNRLPRFAMRKHELPCPPNLVYRMLDGFRVHYAEHNPDCLDGVRVVWPDAWLHLRASNTEPLLRIIVEAEDADKADSLLEDALTAARRMAYQHRGRQNG